MRKTYFVFAAILVLAMVLSACAAPAAAPTAAPQQATEAPKSTEAPKPTDVVVATQLPVATEAPAAEPTATPLPAQNPYVGSGKLDGNGVPGDFFQDVHVRKGFAYAFDVDIVIDDVYQGEAVPASMLMLAGMPGYDENFVRYKFDPEKAAAEFKAADVNKNGKPAGEDPEDIWDKGFRLTMLYNSGNTTRKVYAEILQENLAAINPKFQVEIQELPWPSYLANQRAHRIPILTGGWLEDIHDPHNWYQPYTTGTYGGRQALPKEIKDKFQAFLDKGVVETDPVARGKVYQEMQQLYYDDAIGLPVALATTHNYEQKWLQGRIMNPIYSGIVAAPITKAEGAKNPDALVVANIGDALTMDPLASYDTASGEPIQNIYETLVFYDGVAVDKFVPLLAEKFEMSADGTEWTFTIRKDVKFHEGQDLKPSDVKYSFMRLMLNGGGSSPAWLVDEPFFGVGMSDVTLMIDPEGNLADNREDLLKVEPAKLAAPCEFLDKAITVDEAAGTVKMKLAQPWAPFLPTIANGWGSIVSQEWVAKNGGWDGKCEDWAKYYAIPDSESPFTPIANGTGPYKLSHWKQGEEIALTRNDAYWGAKPALKDFLIKNVAEFGTRLTMLQSGDADIIAVPVEMRTQVDPMVGEMVTYDKETKLYGAAKPVCKVDTALLAAERFELCETASDQPLRLYFGRPALTQDVILYNFDIK
ncbi:MAG: ABC transporter substrate-binding protein [Anaerolineaceae bacterium]|nr:ABC transporter substrate-binding protein [Anaerolineaceae bacterium]